MSSKIEIIRICEFCKNEFTARTTKTLYCSLKCSSRAYKSRTRQSKIAESNRQTQIAKNPDLEIVKTKDFISVNQASTLLGISRRTIYRIISRGELDVAKFGTRTVIRRCDLDGFFSLPLEESMLRPVQEFPGLSKCYTITQIQQKFGISPVGLYKLIQRHGIAKYSVGKFNYVAKKDINIIFNARDNEKD
ncbi:DNA binding domain-containing protein, excisionase family [Flavobacterium resistens]|uniref:DNA binding domain-containing protein, excisionase family n=1 Tax=Flavobacterium resistens TaxID=443612 RepID=A0A521F9A0_9FLAO|nr:helix-turn-helix domain-containing protein [Flavobacterium resistens]MRX70128.1 helix-turn-helix domain-containing protein [Flavobacterium resistens]SMO92070.1 DNA binding domain-containing protein, excisionase family [Flavobacterium resistens]